MTESFFLGFPKKIFFLVFSFVIVAFGQPAWSEWLGIVAAIGGFACFWRVLLDIPKTSHRFLIAMVWFTAVQMVQLSWFFSHPYLYIYAVTLFCASLMGIQWGIIAIWMTPKTFRSLIYLFGLVGLWVIFEWSRLFLLSGLPFNPVGLTLTGSLYSMQLASVVGLYGLSFWVILTNLLFLRAWVQPKNWINYCVVTATALFPYLFGWGHLYFHNASFNQDHRKLAVVLVQSALPIEENLSFQSADEARDFVLNEWFQVLVTLKKQVGKKIDLIVFPEYLVPYGTFHHIFSLTEVQQLFQEVFGKVAFPYPPEESSYVASFWLNNYGKEEFVSNAYIAQTIANFFHSDVVIGLEESHYENERKSISHSSAFHFIPETIKLPERYDKQVLVPMGEYIPFVWCRALAARYGITGSFTPGISAKIFDGPVPFGASICYEEMYGDLMRENRVKGAELLVNLTNDGWYPNSLLPKQHFDHARLRTVENGIPLVRACNTGVTCAVDSLGRIVGVLGENEVENQELADSILVELPLYHYSTFYSRYGDFLIISFSFLLLFISWLYKILSLKK